MSEALDDEQIELLKTLAQAHLSVPRSQRTDFFYLQAMTRTKHVHPRARVEEIFAANNVISSGDALWRSMDDLPKNYDSDFVEHTGLPDGDMQVYVHDMDALAEYDLIHYRDNDHFYVTAKGLGLAKGQPSVSLTLEDNQKNNMTTSQKLIFISHKETDGEIAAKLVDFVLSSLEVSDSQVLCTSVPGHQLEFGPSIAEQLRDSLNTSTALFALLTPASVKASWVLFELGAGWAMNKIVVPILGPGLGFSDLPGPLANSSGVQIENANAANRLMDAIQQVATKLSINQKAGGKAQAKLNDFITAFKGASAADADLPSKPSTTKGHVNKISDENKKRFQAFIAGLRLHWPAGNKYQTLSTGSDLIKQFRKLLDGTEEYREADKVYGALNVLVDVLDIYSGVSAEQQKHLMHKADEAISDLGIVQFW